MRFTVSLADFQKILNKTMPAVPPKATLPVLEHLNFDLSGNKLRIIATDQDITIMSVIDVVGFEDGGVLVPARKLSDIVKALGTKGEIEFIADVENFDIEIKANRGKYAMKGLHPDEYLDLPELFESPKPDLNNLDYAISAKFSKDEISRLANKTHFAVSTDDFRPAMTGVLFQFRSSFVNAVSTDSFRLVKAVQRRESVQYPESLDIIMPSRTVDLLKKADEDVIMSFIESNEKITHTRFDISSTTYISRIIDEKYPPYEAVIPENNPILVVLDKVELLAAIKRIAIFTSTISKQVRLTFANNTLKITGSDDDIGTSGVEEVACDYEGEEFVIGFNHKYLEEAVSHVDTSEDNAIFMTFSEPNRPALIKPNEATDELLMLLMPVRL